MTLGSYPCHVKLAVGDAVVYAVHGVGWVAAREQRTILGVEQEVVVLELATGLRVTLPIQRARDRLRPLVCEADLRAHLAPGVDAPAPELGNLLL
jgi:RNA polymerase-interacting CarD/CdnL/TRCF family regulator